MNTKGCAVVKFYIDDRDQSGESIESIKRGIGIDDDHIARVLQRVENRLLQKQKQNLEIKIKLGAKEYQLLSGVNLKKILTKFFGNRDFEYRLEKYFLEIRFLSWRIWGC